MSQVDYAIPSSSYVQASRAEFITFFEALLTKNSGATEPTVKFAFMFWVDTSTGLIKQRNAANTDWIIWGYYANQGFLRTNAGDPNGALTGNYEGEECYDTTNDRVYKYSGSSTVWYRQAKFSELPSTTLRTVTTTPYTVLTTDSILEWNGTANGTFNLYAVSGNGGRRLTINNITTQYTLTLDGNASETIEGLATYILYPGNSIDIYCDGAKWDIINRPTRVLINTTVVSQAVASVDFTSLITSQFSKYTLEIINAIPSTNQVTCYIRTSSNNGSSWDSGASDYSTSCVMSNTGVVYMYNTTTTFGFLPQIPTNAVEGLGTTASRGVNAVVECSYFTNTANPKVMLIRYANGRSDSDTSKNIGSGSITRNSTSAINAIQVYMSSGNIASGTFKLYGEI